MRMPRSLWVVIFVLVGAGLVEGPQPVSAEGRYLTGRMLVAAPKLKDPYFRHAVVYLVEHDTDGAVGLIINRKMGEGSLADLVGELGLDMQGDRRVGLFFGGPVSQRNVFVLHSADYRGKGTLGAKGAIAMTGDKSIIKAIAAGAGPERTRFMMGYAGWGAGQLEHEIARGDWFDAPVDPGLIFESGADTEDTWRRARDKAGLTL
jgi:putative transcriptional regulator